MVVSRQNLTVFFIVFIEVLSAVSSFAVEPKPLGETKTRRYLVETGASVGSPSAFNLVLGTWGTSEFPFSFRLSGMILGSWVRGLQLQGGWIFDGTGILRQQLFLCFMHTEVSALEKKGDALTIQGIGPGYMLYLSGITALAGVLTGPADTYRLSDNVSGSITPLYITLSLGYSIFW